MAAAQEGSGGRNEAPLDRSLVKGKHLWFDASGEFRTWATYVTPFSVSPDDSVEWDEGFTLMERVRPSASFGGRDLSLHLEGDLFYERMVGDYPQAGSSATRFPPETVVEPESFYPRQLFLQWKSPAGIFRLGHQLSDWGLGISSNGGIEDGMELFSHQVFGDTVERFIYITAPLALSKKLKSKAWVKNLRLAIGTDLIYRDESAFLLKGDLATQQFVTLNWVAPTWQVGGIFIWRMQRDAPKDGKRAYTDVAIFDLTGKMAIPLGRDKLKLVGAFELAYIDGETNKAKSWNGPEGLDVSTFAIVGEVGLEVVPARLTVKALGGYLSGDGDQDDDTLYRYRFDPNFNVGLILFDHYLAGMTAAAMDRAMDPDHAQTPPPGLKGLPTNGALENAAYVAPTLVYGGERGLAAAVMALFAWSAKANSSPYETFAAGGAPTGYRGAATEERRYLGTEIDAALRYRLNVADFVTIELKAEGGILLPGSAFANAAGEKPESVKMVFGRAGVIW
jgi:hypothetical protein